MKKIDLKRQKKIIVFIVVMLGLLLVGVVLAFFAKKEIIKTIYSCSNSQPDASYLKDFYGNKRVLLVVPHEDDEVNVGSGILEQYVNNGSEVYVTWLTNGDAYGGGDRRINESIAAMTTIGIPEENLYFLGYGDSWDAGDFNHIYHCPGDMLVPSMCQLTYTYGTDTHPDYHTSKFGESAAYTRDNICADIKDVILSTRADVIYAVDCDEHQDHRACSLFFEEIMGQILKEDTSYRPKIFKGFGYCTAWDGIRDYYAENVMDTANPSEHDYMDKRPCYMWEDRIKLPVAADTLAYTMRASSLYNVIACHASQEALNSFECIVNSDKVFWERRVDSITHRGAVVEATSGDTEGLIDFKLTDTKNVRNENIKWNRGVWTPDEGDDKKCVRISFDKPYSIDRVVLYDSASKEASISDVTLSFSDGSSIAVDNIVDCGAPTNVSFDEKENIEWIEVSIGSLSGKHAGLSEIEVFECKAETTDPYRFVKLTIGDNFAYDYRCKKGDVLELGAYFYPQNSYTDYEILLDGCIVEADNLRYDGKRHTLRLQLKADPQIYDEVYLRPITPLNGAMYKIARQLELRDR